MAKNIADALDALALVQMAVTASVGGTTFTTQRVWKYAPPAAHVLTDTPEWINTVRIEPRREGISMRRLFYAIRTQLFIEDADNDRGIEAATRMSMDYIDRLDANVTLKDAGGMATVTRLTYRGSDPTFGIAERNSHFYQVLDMWVDVQILTGHEFS